MSWTHDYDNLNLWRDVKQGTGVHSYDDVYYQGDVRLGVQNNNYSEKVNTIEGRWDEE